jgi:small subunit ribosomal protein S15
MSRIHSRRKGKASSKRPAKRELPAWVTMQKKEAEDLIVQLGRSGKTQAQIGLILRDQYGVPDIQLLTGKSVSRILAEAGIAPQIPEDLAALIERARNVSQHLQEHKKDYSNKRGLQLIESKIRRLAKYYIREGKLPENWTYSYEALK